MKKFILELKKQGPKAYGVFLSYLEDKKYWLAQALENGSH